MRLAEDESYRALIDFTGCLHPMVQSFEWTNALSLFVPNRPSGGDNPEDNPPAPLSCCRLEATRPALACTYPCHIRIPRNVPAHLWTGLGEASRGALSRVVGVRQAFPKSKEPIRELNCPHVLERQVRRTSIVDRTSSSRNMTLITHTTHSSRPNSVRTRWMRRPWDNGSLSKVS